MRSEFQYKSMDFGLWSSYSLTASVQQTSFLLLIHIFKLHSKHNYFLSLFIDLAKFLLFFFSVYLKCLNKMRDITKTRQSTFTNPPDCSSQAVLPQRYMCKWSVSDHAPSAKDLVQNTGIHLAEGILKVYVYLVSHPLYWCGKVDKQLHHLPHIMVLWPTHSNRYGKKELLKMPKCACANF
jgi:hypothetical protein